MEYVRLGSTGVRISRACLGCEPFGSSALNPWALDEETSFSIVREAVELGINFFDTADVYSLGRSEEVLGKAVKEFMRRDEVLIATKVFFPMGDSPNGRGLSRKHILSSADASLKRLGTDYIDLYQIHRWDADTPIEETLDALDYLVRSGRVRYLGASSMFAWQLAKALFTADRLGKARFVSMSSQYNLIFRWDEREMIPLCRDQGLAVLPWGSLARGFLAGNRSAQDRGGATLRSKTDKIAQKWFYSPSDFTVVDVVKRLAGELRCSAAQVAIAWVASRIGVTAPVIAATRIGQLRELVAALDIKLPSEGISMLQAASQPTRWPDHW